MRSLGSGLAAPDLQWGAKLAHPQSVSRDPNLAFLLEIKKFQQDLKTKLLFTFQSFSLCYLHSFCH